MHAVLNSLRILVCCFLLFFSMALNAQASFEMLGTMIPDGQIPMTYKVVFDINNGIVKGYTLSDIGGKYETKARIKGTFDVKTKTITFTESEILYTQYKKGNNNFCMPSVSGKLITKKEKSYIEGRFQGHFLGSKKSCGGGKVILMSAKDIYTQLAGLAKQIDNIPGNDSTINAVKAGLNKIQAVDEVHEMQHNAFYSKAWEAQHITLEIWDDGVEDNDRIYISSTDSSIHESILITRKKQIVHYPFPKTKNSIRLNIRAENEGQYTPNTVKIVLVDDAKRYMVLSRLNKDEIIQLNFFRKK